MSDKYFSFKYFLKTVILLEKDHQTSQADFGASGINGLNIIFIQIKE